MGNALNFSMHSQDIYYDFLHIKRAVKIGKTLNMSMVELFFSVNYADARAKICEILRGLFIKYAFLRESEVLTDADRDYASE